MSLSFKKVNVEVAKYMAHFLVFIDKLQTVSETCIKTNSISVRWSIDYTWDNIFVIMIRQDFNKDRFSLHLIRI